MELVISPHGQVRCLYSEAIELSALGALSIQRASHVEPDTNGRWFADLSLSDGPLWGRLSVVPTRSRPKPRGCRPIARTRPAKPVQFLHVVLVGRLMLRAPGDRGDSVGQHFLVVLQGVLP